MNKGGQVCAGCAASAAAPCRAPPPAPQGCAASAKTGRKGSALRLGLGCAAEGPAGRTSDGKRERRDTRASICTAEETRIISSRPAKHCSCREGAGGTTQNGTKSFSEADQDTENVKDGAAFLGQQWRWPNSARGGSVAPAREPLTPVTRAPRARPPGGGRRRPRRRRGPPPVHTVQGPCAWQQGRGGRVIGLLARWQVPSELTIARTLASRRVITRSSLCAQGSH